MTMGNVHDPEVRKAAVEKMNAKIGNDHLADTGLIAEIEKDYAASCYGDEILFGYDQ